MIADGGGNIASVFRRIAERQAAEERDRTEMFLQVGRAIVTLSEIEELTADIFTTVSLPMPVDESAKLFYEVQNISHKLKLIDYAIMMRGWEDGQKRWKLLSSRISTQKFVRNVAAHASLEFKQEPEGKTWRVTLGTQAMDKSHKKSEYEITDMRKTGDDLQDIQRSVKKFLFAAVGYFNPQRLEP